ncbi:hypothetical protein JCM11641_003962 [Rhodosporidiobolus odoratus]
MDKLAPETRLHIFRLCTPSFATASEAYRPLDYDDQLTLTSFALVSHAWNDLATSLLYPNVELAFNEAQLLFLRTIKAKPGLGKKVRSLGRELRELILVGNLIFHHDLPTFPHLVTLSLQPTVLDMPRNVSPSSWLCSKYLPSLRALSSHHSPHSAFDPLGQFPDLRAFAGFGGRWEASRILFLSPSSLPACSIIDVDAKAFRYEDICEGYISNDYNLDPAFLALGSHLFLFRAEKLKERNVEGVIEALSTAFQKTASLAGSDNPPSRLKGIFVPQENVYSSRYGKQFVKSLKELCESRGIWVRVVESGDDSGNVSMFPEGFFQEALEGQV